MLSQNHWYGSKIESKKTTRYCGDNSLKCFEPAAKENALVFFPQTFTSPAAKRVAQISARVTPMSDFAGNVALTQQSSI